MTSAYERANAVRTDSGGGGGGGEYRGNPNRGAQEENRAYLRYTGLG